MDWLEHAVDTWNMVNSLETWVPAGMLCSFDMMVVGEWKGLCRFSITLIWRGTRHNWTIHNCKMCRWNRNTWQESVMHQLRFPRHKLTFACLRLWLVDEVFWNALDPIALGSCNVLLRVSIATRSSSSRIVSRVAFSGVGFLATFLRFCDGRDILFLWIRISHWRSTWW